MQHLIELKGSHLFEEYLHSLGVSSCRLDREQEIYLQDWRLATVWRIQGELRFYLRASTLARS